MRTSVRISAEWLHVIGMWARQLGFGESGAIARVCDDPVSGKREYLVTSGTLRVPDPDVVPVYFRAQLAPPTRRRRRDDPPPDPPPEDTSFLLIDTDHPDSPRASLVDLHGGQQELDEIVLVGRGMRVVRRVPRPGLSLTVDELRHGRWSRTVGGLGGDFGALRRLQQADLALLGCGRNGALIATHLAALGLEGRLTLIDDDLVEEHNADAMGLDPDDWAGVPKVEALTHLVRQQNLVVTIDTIERAADAPEAIAAMARADVVLCAVDHGEGRLVASTVGAAFLRPVLDVGTGIGREHGVWHAGCDIRLTLPGHCLLCFGGVERLDASRDGDWWQQRAGSLRSLNSIGTGIAQWMLERLYSSTRVDSAWVRVTAHDDGGIETRTVHHVPEFEPCPVCERLGTGWHAFGHARERGRS